MNASLITADISKLQDILGAIDALSGCSLRDFMDRQKLHAAAFEFVIIGEATRQISQAFKNEHSHLPWREMQDTRNKIAHEYGTLSPKRMIEIIQDELPELRRQIVVLLNHLESGIK